LCTRAAAHSSTYTYANNRANPTPTPIPGIDEFVWANGVDLKVISFTVQDEYVGMRSKDVSSNLVVINIEFGEGEVPDRLWDEEEMYLAYEFDIYKNHASPPEVVESYDQCPARLLGLARSPALAIF
jgi:hypothetical protein